MLVLWGCSYGQGIGKTRVQTEGRVCMRKGKVFGESECRFIECQELRVLHGLRGVYPYQSKSDYRKCHPGSNRVCPYEPNRRFTNKDTKTKAANCHLGIWHQYQKMSPLRKSSHLRRYIVQPVPRVSTLPRLSQAMH